VDFSNENRTALKLTAADQTFPNVNFQLQFPTTNALLGDCQLKTGDTSD